jgi:uncharacterized protein (UPF0335 family)
MPNIDAEQVARILKRAERHRQENRKICEALAEDGAGLRHVGNFLYVPIYAVRPARVTDDEWKKWLDRFERFEQETKP